MPTTWSPSKPCVEDCVHLDATALAHAQVLVPDSPSPRSFIWAWPEIDEEDNWSGHPDYMMFNDPMVHPFRRHRRSRVYPRCTQAGFLYPASKPIRGPRRRRFLPDYSEVEPIARINLRVLTKDGTGDLTLDCRVNDRKVSQGVPLSTTRPPFGGLKWWLACPGCRSRTGKLYIPIGPGIRPSDPRFLCRTCWGLTHRSAQQAHRWERSDRVWARMMASSG